MDLTNPSTFRDFSKPMGAQNSARLKRFMERYKYFEDPTGENNLLKQFHAHNHTTTHILHYIFTIVFYYNLFFFYLFRREYPSLLLRYPLLLSNDSSILPHKNGAFHSALPEVAGWTLVPLSLCSLLLLYLPHIPTLGWSF